jgi:hypothetical protein
LILFYDKIFQYSIKSYKDFADKKLPIIKYNIGSLTYRIIKKTILHLKVFNAVYKSISQSIDADLKQSALLLHYDKQKLIFSCQKQVLPYE